jgi:hypothetical protein
VVLWIGLRSTATITSPFLKSGRGHHGGGHRSGHHHGSGNHGAGHWNGGTLGWPSHGRYWHIDHHGAVTAGHYDGHTAATVTAMGHVGVTQRYWQIDHHGGNPGGGH